MAIFVHPRWPPAAILDFIESEIAPFDPPFPKTLLEPKMEWIGCSVCEIFAFKLYCDLETGVRGHSKSSKVTPFDSLHMVSYYRPVVTLCLKCTVFEIWRHIGWKSSKKNKPPSFGTFLWGDPLRIFRRVIPCQKLESWGYQMVYISRSCFRSARHSTGVWQTDRRTDTSLSQRRAIAYIYAVARNKNNIQRLTAIMGKLTKGPTLTTKYS